MKGIRSVAISVISISFILCSSESRAENIKLRFGWWGSEQHHRVTLESIKLFESKNPGLTITGEYMGYEGYLERLVTQFSASNEPDIMELEWSWVSTIISKSGNGLYDLYAMKNLLSLDQFSGKEKSGIVNGKLNALPVSYATKIFFWQKPVFDKAGLKIPGRWDDLLGDGKVFESKLGKDYYPLIGSLHDRIFIAHSWILQKTGKSLIANNEPKIALTKDELLDFIRFFRKLSESHTVTPPFGDVEETIQSMQPEWIQGKWAGGFKWSKDLPIYQKTFSKAELETRYTLAMKGETSSGVYSRPSSMFAIGKRTKHPEIAVKFLNFILTDSAAARIQGTVRGVPAARSSFNLLQKEKALTSFQIREWMYLDKTKPGIPSPWIEHIRVQSFLDSVLGDLSLGKISEEKAATRINDELPKILRLVR